MKVGDYCYIKNERRYGIGKVYDFRINNNVRICLKRCMAVASINNVVSNESLFELITVGDYVNGWKITTIDKRNHKLYAEYDDGYLIQTISQKNIKSVVTKEQFDLNEYKLEV